MGSVKQVEEIWKYIDIALDRKYLILIPFLLTILAGLTYALKAQPMFRAETLILVVAQKVPENYVRSLVHLGMDERLQTIQQQVTSRTNLEKIMREYLLFNEPGRAGLLTETKIELFRKRIQTNVVRGTAFSITFDYEEAKTAMDITNKLASNFIEENLKIREDQALGTSEFLHDELELMRRRLEEQEEKVRAYHQQYLGALPQDLTANLSNLQRLQTRLDQLTTSLAAAEERRLILLQQVTSQKMMEQKMAGLSSAEANAAGRTRGDGGDIKDLTALRNELLKLEAKYTENHPEVRRLKSMIANLESQQSDTGIDGGDVKNGRKKTVVRESVSMSDVLKPQLQQVTSEITSLRLEIEKIKGQVETYEQRVEETPNREQEMILLTRDYETIKSQYANLVQRKLEADVALSMEKKQKGEQFKLLDLAKLPEKPISPDPVRVLLYSVLVGLCLGGGIAFAVEVLDTSYKSPEEVEGELDLPVIGCLAYRYTEKELQRHKFNEVMKGTSVALGFGVSVLCILLITKGADKTFDFIKNIFVG